MSAEYIKGPLDGHMVEFPEEGVLSVSIHTGDSLKESDWYRYNYDEYENKLHFDVSMFSGHKFLSKMFASFEDDDSYKLDLNLPEIKQKCGRCKEEELWDGFFVLGYCQECIVKLYRNGGLVDK